MMKHFKYVGIMSVALLTLGVGQDARANMNWDTDPAYATLPSKEDLAKQAAYFQSLAGTGTATTGTTGATTQPVTATGTTADPKDKPTWYSAAGNSSSSSSTSDTIEMVKDMTDKQLKKAKVELALLAKKEVKTAGAGLLNNAFGSIANTATGKLSGSGIATTLTNSLGLSGSSATSALGKAGIGLLTGTTTVSQVAGSAIKDLTGSLAGSIKSSVSTSTSGISTAVAKPTVSTSTAGTAATTATTATTTAAGSTGVVNVNQTAVNDYKSGTQVASNSSSASKPGCWGSSNGSGWDTQ